MFRSAALFERQASHVSSPAKILLAISGSRDAGRAAHPPCLRGRSFAGREWLRRIFTLVDASPRVELSAYADINLNGRVWLRRRR
jgi:hypothetical protein